MFRVSASEMRGTRLLNPNVRISEAPYDVGFQSLTEFNHTFKHVFGESPSDFRAYHSSGDHTLRPARSLGRSRKSVALGSRSRNRAKAH